MVLLEWATDEQQSKRPTVEERDYLKQLQESLLSLLHRLLLGHMLDEALNIDRIARCPCCSAHRCAALRWPWGGGGLLEGWVRSMDCGGAGQLKDHGCVMLKHLDAVQTLAAC